MPGPCLDVNHECVYKVSQCIDVTHKFVYKVSLCQDVNDECVCKVSPFQDVNHEYVDKVSPCQGVSQAGGQPLRTNALIYLRSCRLVLNGRQKIMVDCW